MGQADAVGLGSLNLLPDWIQQLATSLDLPPSDPLKFSTCSRLWPCCEGRSFHLGRTTGVARRALNA